jgi:hypothetical protein
MAAAVVIGSLKITSHFENGKLLVNSMLPRSYRIARPRGSKHHMVTDFETTRFEQASCSDNVPNAMAPTTLFQYIIIYMLDTKFDL